MLELLFAVWFAVVLLLLGHLVVRYRIDADDAWEEDPLPEFGRPEGPAELMVEAALVLLWPVVVAYWAACWLRIAWTYRRAAVLDGQPVQHRPELDRS